MVDLCYFLSPYLKQPQHLPNCYHRIFNALHNIIQSTVITMTSYNSFVCNNINHVYNCFVFRCPVQICSCLSVHKCGVDNVLYSQMLFFSRLSEDGEWSEKDIKFKPGDVHRTFFTVPNGATWAGNILCNPLFFIFYIKIRRYYRYFRRLSPPPNVTLHPATVDASSYFLQAARLQLHHLWWVSRPSSSFAAICLNICILPTVMAQLLPCSFKECINFVHTDVYRLFSSILTKCAPYSIFDTLQTRGEMRKLYSPTFSRVCLNNTKTRFKKTNLLQLTIAVKSRCFSRYHGRQERKTTGQKLLKL